MDKQSGHLQTKVCHDPHPRRFSTVCFPTVKSANAVSDNQCRHWYLAIICFPKYTLRPPLKTDDSEVPDDDEELSDEDHEPIPTRMIPCGFWYEGEYSGLWHAGDVAEEDPTSDDEEDGS